MDLALQQNNNGLFDIEQNGADLKNDRGLRTAVVISLFTDARALDDDVLPGNDEDRRGHWTDSYSDRSLGSRLWLLERESAITDVLERAKEYATEALQWLIEDGIAQTINVLTDWFSDSNNKLGITITILQSDGSTWQETFEYELKAA